MKKKVLVIFTFLLSLVTASGQDTTFWFAPPTTFATGNSMDGRGGFLFTNTTNRTASVNVHHYKTGLDSSFTIPPKGEYHLSYTKAEVLANLEVRNIDVGLVMPGGVKITSDEKVMVYYLYDVSAIKDIYTLKGKQALGNEFYVPQTSDGYWLNQAPGLLDHIAIMATENNTQVTFTPTRDCHRGGAIDNGVWSDYGIVSTYMAGTTYTETLNQGEALILAETRRGTAGVFSTLAGTHIISNNPICVTTDESCTGLDEIGDQIVPTSNIGTLYAVTKGYTLGAGIKEHIYILAKDNGTTVTINEPGGGTVNLGPINAGQTAVYDMGDRSAPPYAVSVETSEPAYVYHVSAASTHPAGALVPSIYSVGQNQFSFYQLSTSTNDNGVMLVYRDTCDQYFTISYGGTTDTLVNSVGTPAPGVTVDTPDSPVPGIPGWNFMRLHLPVAANNQTVTLKNSESSFSLGYFSGDDGAGQYCAYGYLSGFGEFEFEPDTIWRCTPRPVNLIGGYARSYKWTLPNGTILTTPMIRARDAGMYILEMDQDFRTTIDTCWVLDMVFNAKLQKEPTLPKPAKVGVPQKFSCTVNTDLPDLTYEWTFEGAANPKTSNSANPIVTWSATGEQKVTLKLTSKGAASKDTITCDTTIIAYFDVMPKNIGYFVKQSGGNDKNNGRSWQTAFSTVQRALEHASQGDYIWVAKGTYTPPTNGASFTIDYDSVQLYGGFSGWENKLNERILAINPTVLKGRKASVVIFDGSNSYITSGGCGVGTDARLDGFIIQEGEAQMGAGVQFTNGASGTIAYCEIKNNHASISGGGIFVEAIGPCGHADPMLINSVISGNYAPQGAGIYNAGSNMVMINSTISGNVSEGAGGMHNTSGSPDLRNTIIWGNNMDRENDTDRDIIVSSGTPTYSHCIVGGSLGSKNWLANKGHDGGNNLDATPFFRKNGFNQFGQIQVGNYQLSGHSVAANSGYNKYILQGKTLTNITLQAPKDTVYYYGIPVDLVGLDRMMEEIVDRGAYEYNPNDSFQVYMREIVIPGFEEVTTEPSPGVHYVESHKDFIIIIKPNAGFSLDHIKITSGSDLQDAQGSRIEHLADGSVKLTFIEVTEPLILQIMGISPVSKERLENSNIWSEGSSLFVKAINKGVLTIYTLKGQIYRQQQIEEGQTILPLPKGVYVVTLDNTTRQKVVIQ